VEVRFPVFGESLEGGVACLVVESSVGFPDGLDVLADEDYFLVEVLNGELVVL
jgi:hypothetical protein